MNSTAELPLISVVVPNYNQGEFIGSAIESIVSQKYPAIEILVIDGGSNDKSIDVIKKYSDAIHFWCSESDEGHYDAVNKGMRLARGEVLCFLNSDDMLFPGSLMIIGEIFSMFPEAEWVTSLLPAAWDVTDKCMGVTNIPGYSRKAFIDAQYLGKENAPWFIQQESTFWRRSIWNRTGACMRSEVSHAGDFDLWCRFYEQGDLYGINALLGGFRIRNGQRGAEGDIYMNQCKQLLNEFRKHSDNLNLPKRWLTDFCLATGLFYLYGLGRILRRTIGYRGNRFVRHDPGGEEVKWVIEEYRFP